MKLTRQEIDSNFPYKVWLGTITIGSVLFIGIMALLRTGKEGVISAFSNAPLFIIYAFFGSLFISIPSLVIQVTFFEALTRLSLSLKTVKISMVILGSILVFLTFYVTYNIILGEVEELSWIIPTIYTSILVILTGIFRLQKTTLQIAAEDS